MGTKSDALKSMGHFIGGVGISLIGIAMLMKSCDDNSLVKKNSCSPEIDYKQNYIVFP
jgi:hypothetical protein